LSAVAHGCGPSAWFLQLGHFDRSPKVLAPNLLDRTSLCLNWVLVLGKELNRFFDTRAQVLDHRSVWAALDQLDFEARHQQVEPVRVFVTADAAKVLERRSDREQVRLCRRCELADAVTIRQRWSSPIGKACSTVVYACLR
jgi:hypothetical protein